MQDENLSSQADFGSENVPIWDPPKLTEEDRSAARILAHLINYGYAPVVAPTLPPAWQSAYDAVFASRTSTRNERFRAFVSSFEPPDPNYFLFRDAIDEYPANDDDRREKNRILYWASEALKPPPQQQWVVQGLFARPSLNMLVGNPGTKKTFLSIDLALSVALGKPWLGREVIKDSTVLFIDEETGLHNLWERFNSALAANNVKESVSLAYISLGGYILSTDSEADELIQRAVSIGANLIIIDALANLIRGTGESNIATVQPVLFNLRRMAEYCNAAVLVIHHNNRQGLFRGSSAISAAVDLMLSIESEPQDSLITLRTLKARFEAPATFSARAHFETNDSGGKRFLLTPCENPILAPPASPAEPPDSSAANLAFLRQSPGATRATINSNLPQFSPTTIRGVLHKLMISGLVKRTDGSKKGMPGTYESSH